MLKNLLLKSNVIGEDIAYLCEKFVLFIVSRVNSGLLLLLVLMAQK